jgi:hypothetical protein
VVIPASYLHDGPRTHEVAARIFDKNGDSTNVQTTITIEDTAPTIALSGNQSVAEGAPYTLSLGAVTDPGNDSVTKFIVDWADGQIDTYTNAGDVTHVYTDGAADFTVRVDLKDEDGTHTDSGSHAVTVQNIIPTIAISGPNRLNEGAVYTLDLGPVADPGQDTVSEWVVHGC